MFLFKMNNNQIIQSIKINKVLNYFQIKSKMLVSFQISLNLQLFLLLLARVLESSMILISLCNKNDY